MKKNIEHILDEGRAERNPFLVPEGYFDNLTARVMDSIPAEAPAKKTKARIVPMRIVRWAAACVCFVAVCTTAYIHFNPATNGAGNAADVAFVDDSNDDIIQAADYAMLDNQDMYHLLAEQ